MYFDSIPDISYATKPSKFPFAEGDFVRAKNFFRRYNLNETVFNYAVFFRKYTIVDGVVRFNINEDVNDMRIDINPEEKIPAFYEDVDDHELDGCMQGLHDILSNHK